MRLAGHVDQDQRVGRIQKQALDRQSAFFQHQCQCRRKKQVKADHGALESGGCGPQRGQKTEQQECQGGIGRCQILMIDLGPDILDGHANKTRQLRAVRRQPVGIEALELDVTLPDVAVDVVADRIGPEERPAGQNQQQNHSDTGLKGPRPRPEAHDREHGRKSPQVKSGIDPRRAADRPQAREQKGCRQPAGGRQAPFYHERDALRR